MEICQLLFATIWKASYSQWVVYFHPMASILCFLCFLKKIYIPIVKSVILTYICLPTFTSFLLPPFTIFTRESHKNGLMTLVDRDILIKADCAFQTHSLRTMSFHNIFTFITYTNKNSNYSLKCWPLGHFLLVVVSLISTEQKC